MCNPCDTKPPDREHLTRYFVQHPFDGRAIPKFDAMLRHCSLLLPCAAVKWVAGRLQGDWLHCAPHTDPFLSRGSTDPCVINSTAILPCQSVGFQRNSGKSSSPHILLDILGSRRCYIPQNTSKCGDTAKRPSPHILGCSVLSAPQNMGSALATSLTENAALVQPAAAATTRNNLRRTPITLQQYPAAPQAASAQDCMHVHWRCMPCSMRFYALRRPNLRA
jgi:hypothetical protein